MLLIIISTGFLKSENPLCQRLSEHFILFARTTFAWFTSKDEVTNRLSASADYNVVAIENFSPPKQFVPGQTVKKEEAVTNTGSIDAFVKQTISGVLEVTVEVPSTVNPKNAGTEASKYITYTKQNEWGAIEAGSMLAWAPAESANKPGVIIGMGISGNGTGTPEGATGDLNDFNPDKTGLYVFRRAIDKDATVSKDVDYDYVAYYYVANSDTDPSQGGKYYKVYALKVDEGQIDTSDYLTAGILKKEPAYTFSKAVTTYANKQDMYYEDLGGTNRRLVVKFNGRNTVDEAIVTATEHTNKEIYDAYNVYETHNLGETVYEAPTGYTGDYSAYTMWDEADAADWGASSTHKDTNETGLTTYDIYDQDKTYTPDDKTPQGDLSNFGLARLTELQTQTDTALDTAEAGYSDLQTAARTSRKTVNEGRDAEVDLAEHLTTVYGKIGQAATYTGTTDSSAVSGNEGGLYLKETSATANNANSYEWQAYMITDGASVTLPTYRNDGSDTAPSNVGLSSTATEPAGFVKFKYGANNASLGAGEMGFADHSSSGLSTAVMTADNVNEKRFADPGSTYKDWSSITAPTWDATVTYYPGGDTTAAAETIADYDAYLALTDAEKATVSDSNMVTEYESTVGYGVKWDHVTAPATSGTLVPLWNNYVYQTQRKVLNLKKQELVKKVIDDNTGIQTDVGRSVDEAKVYLEALKEELKGIETDLAAAKTAYTTEANSIKAEIEKMNKCQLYVDNANKQYDTYLDTTQGTGADAVDYVKPSASKKADGTTAVVVITEVSAAQVVNGTKDTPKEDTFETKLKTIFGVAEKDTAFKYNEKAISGSDYTGDETPVDYESDYLVYALNETNNLCTDTTNHVADADQAVGHATDVFTYSVKATKDKIDANLSDGVAPTDNETTITVFNNTDYTTDAQKNAIMSAPYWKDVVTDNMVTYRTGKKDAAYTAYQNLLDENAMLKAQQDLVASEGSATTDEVKLYVNLVNVVDAVDGTTTNDKWQYVGDSVYDTKSAKDFVFGYTGILEAGETSSLLIKSVEFDEHTTQDSFRDLKFDINVAVESAQAVYNANRVQADAAKTLTVIVPTQNDYENDESVVAWSTIGATATALPDENDPNPKDIDVAPKTYTVGGASVATPVELGTPITVGTTVYKYAIVIDGKTYYGTDKTNDTEYKEANAEGTGLQEGGTTVTLKVE